MGIEKYIFGKIERESFPKTELKIIDLSSPAGLWYHLPKLICSLNSDNRTKVQKRLDDLILNNLDALAEKNNFKSCLKCLSPPLEIFSKDKKDDRCDIFIVGNSFFKPNDPINSLIDPTPLYIENINKIDIDEYSKSFFEYKDLSGNLNTNLVTNLTYGSIPIAAGLGIVLGAVGLANDLSDAYITLLVLTGMSAPIISAFIAGKQITNNRIKRWLNLKEKLSYQIENYQITRSLSTLNKFCPDLYEQIVNCIKKGEEGIKEFEENIAVETKQADVLYSIALDYQKTKKWDKAYKTWEKYLMIKPGYFQDEEVTKNFQKCFEKKTN